MLSFQSVALWVAFLLIPASYAAPVPVGGAWGQFWSDPNVAPLVQGCELSAFPEIECPPGSDGDSFYLGGQPWTFFADTPVILRITDVDLSGDRFEVYDFGVLLGVTPEVGPFGDCGIRPSACYKDPNFSHASWILAPGPHEISVQLGPSEDRELNVEGFIRICPVPEPATLYPLGFGLLLIGVLRGRYM